MTRSKNTTGTVIGDLTIEARLDRKAKDGSRYYLMRCSCGGTKEALPNKLRSDLASGKPISCGCMSKPRYKDITGSRKGKLVALENTMKKSNNGDYIWLFQCDCGNQKEITIGNFNFEHTTSCGCARSDAYKERDCYHGLSGTQAYRAWCKIKERCFDENNCSYPAYGGAGISMSDEYKDNFLAFFEEVGHPPEDTENRYSIDRINNTLGYIKGNMRWATTYQQARNKGLLRKNKTGYKGVLLDNKRYKTKDGTVKDRFYYKATWYNMDGKQEFKYFSVNKYGSELALFLAQEYRTTMMERLNLLGAGYTHYHIYGTEEA